jgi:hypothetical protein
MTSVSTKSDPLAHDPLQRDAHRVGGVCARSDLGQLGERLVVVSVDKGQLHPGVSRSLVASRTATCSPA